MWRCPKKRNDNNCWTRQGIVQLSVQLSACAHVACCLCEQLSLCIVCNTAQPHRFCGRCYRFFTRQCEDSRVGNGASKMDSKKGQ